VLLLIFIVLVSDNLYFVLQQTTTHTHTKDVVSPNRWWNRLRRHVQGARTFIFVQDDSKDLTTFIELHEKIGQHNTAKADFGTPARQPNTDRIHEYTKNKR
jgi:hypothetical protein